MNELDTDIKNKSDEQETGQGFINHLNFLAYAPCAFKPTFKKGLDNALGAYRNETGILLNSFVPMGCGGNDDLYNDIWKSTDIDDLPDVIASMGFGDFFRKKFVDRFVAKGCFTSVWKGSVNEPFEKAGFRDPDECYTVYGVMPYILLVDRKRLGNIPLPKQWCDLFEPRFRDNIIICGSEDEVADVPLLYLYKEYGEAGLARFAANVKASYHAAEMARIAGTSNPGGAAVYILPWFFASCCPRTETVSMVWPEDGACSSPLYFLVKTSKMKDMTAIIEYVTGTEMGRQCAHYCFPSLNPNVDNNLPENASFKWLGWDYIKSHDPAELRDYAHNVFISEWRKAREGGKL